MNRGGEPPDAPAESDRPAGGFVARDASGELARRLGLARGARRGRWATAAFANLAGLGGFFGLLYWSRMPGEAIDRDAAIFGAAVYLLYGVVDLFWVPWRCR